MRFHQRRLTFGLSLTHQRHLCSIPTLMPILVPRTGFFGGGVPSSAIHTALLVFVRSVPFCSLVMPIASHSLAGPLHKSVSRRTADPLAIRIWSMPLIGASARNNTATPSPSSPHTGLQHQCMPYVKYT